MKNIGLKNVNATQDFVEMENQIMTFWEEKEIEKKYLEKNKISKAFLFYRWSITANNPMGVHHAWEELTRILYKDIRIMQGFSKDFRMVLIVKVFQVEVG